MKKILLIAISLVCFTAFAQYTAADFRIVDGQLYNIKRSVKWEDISYGNDLDETHCYVVVRAILSDGSLDCDQQHWDTERDTGRFLASVNRIILKNYPEEPSIGMNIMWCRAMKLKSKPGDTANTYDYGLPNTPENRKTLRIPVSTNAPALINTNALIQK